MKVCPRCKVPRKITEFRKYRSKGKNYLFAYCNTCLEDPEYIAERRRKAKENYYKNHEHRKAYGRKYQKIAWDWQKKISASKKLNENIEKIYSNG